MQDYSKFSCLVYEDAENEGVYRHRLVKKTDVKSWAQYLLYACGRESVMAVNFDIQGKEQADTVVYGKPDETKK